MNIRSRNRRARTKVFEFVLDVPFHGFGRGVHDAGSAFAFLDFKTEAVLGAELLGRGFVNGLIDIGEDAQFHQVGDQLERLAF